MPDYRVSQLAPPQQWSRAHMPSDEVLNGKTKDTNSNFFAQFCFDLGIEL